MTALEETFGEYGGQYVPETLIPALDELTAAWNEAKDDPPIARSSTSSAGRTSVARRRSRSSSASRPAGAST